MASKKETKTNKSTAKASTKIKPAKKIIKKVNTKTSPVVNDVEENEEEVELDLPKSKEKKPLEIDAADMLPEVDDKAIDEENPLLSLEDEESDEDSVLDDEDLNPFGDKWEQ